MLLHTEAFLLNIYFAPLLGEERGFMKLPIDLKKTLELAGRAAAKIGREGAEAALDAATKLKKWQRLCKRRYAPTSSR